jgi:hypothetical protein
LRRLFSRRRGAGTAAGDLTCRQLVELVTDDLEGALDARDRARFASHVDSCAGCAAYLEQMRETLRVLGALEPEALHPVAERELLAAFRGWKEGGGP